MQIKLKRIFALLLVLLTALTLFACRPKQPTDQGSVPAETQGLILLPTAIPEDSKAPEEDTAAPIELPTAAPTAEPTATPKPTPTPKPTAVPPTEAPVAEDGIYDSKDEVALYIHLYGHLPSNYITKKEAQELGWTGGSLEPYAPGKCIGGDYFGNYEHQLPTKKGRTYHECDIGTLGRSSRGAKRIVYSNDGLIYYTGDHYEHFTLLYGGD